MSAPKAIVIGSGFGGSVSALRLSEKGYKVLVIEKGRWFSKPEEFPKTNWNLRKWFWLPKMGLKGLFQMHFFRHVAVLSGVLALALLVAIPVGINADTALTNQANQALLAQRGQLEMAKAQLENPQVIEQVIAQGEQAGQIPATARNNVDLPDPDSPTKAKV